MIKKFVESLYFIRIILSPLTIGFIIGGLVYLYRDGDKLGLFLFEIFTLVGLAVGIYWAVFVSKKQSSSDFMTYSDTNNDQNTNETDSK